jgi:hypothetical protein
MIVKPWAASAESASAPMTTPAVRTTRPNRILCLRRCICFLLIPTLPHSTRPSILRSEEWARSSGKGPYARRLSSLRAAKAPNSAVPMSAKPPGSGTSTGGRTCAQAGRAPVRESSTAVTQTAAVSHLVPHLKASSHWSCPYFILRPAKTRQSSVPEESRQSHDRFGGPSKVRGRVSFRRVLLSSRLHEEPHPELPGQRHGPLRGVRREEHCFEGFSNRRSISSCSARNRWSMASNRRSISSCSARNRWSMASNRRSISSCSARNRWSMASNGD